MCTGTSRIAATPIPAELTRLLGEYGDPLPEVVAATPESQVLCHQLYDRDPVESWSRGSTVLLGDAAHPMLPFLGQGACAALEDAVELGRAVEEADGIRAAIDAYEAKRVGRTADLVKGSRKAAKAALLPSKAGRRVRNALDLACAGSSPPSPTRSGDRAGRAPSQ